MNGLLQKIVALLILGFELNCLIASDIVTIQSSIDIFNDEEPIEYNDAAEAKFEPLLYPDTNYFDGIQLTQFEDDSSKSKSTLHDLDPYISNYLKGIYFPAVKYNGVHFGSTVIELQSPALHRVIRKYYYYVLNVLFMVPDYSHNDLFYEKFNEQLANVLNRVIKFKKPDENDINLEFLIDFFTRHKSIMPSMYDLPEDNMNYAGMCRLYVSFLKVPVKPHNFFLINFGPLNLVNKKIWIKNNCAILLEAMNTNIIPYFDDEGVDIRPPVVVNDKVKFRGNFFEDKELFNDCTLFRIYRCVITKINFVPDRTERMCYYYEFNRRFLEFLNNYQPTYMIEDTQSLKSRLLPHE